MRAVIQRVSEAHVSIDGRERGSIGPGLVVLLGVGEKDTEVEAGLLWKKISNLRIFEDCMGKSNLSLMDVGGQCMVISQFTLYADCRKGRRPSFTGAMPPDEAKRLYERFLLLVQADVADVAHGEFGAMMDVELVNSGPFTICLDTDEL